MNTTKNDEFFLKRAAELSREGMEKNAGGPFGAVVAKNGEIVAEAYNEATSINDPTAHAEVLAIRRACERFSSFQLENCVLYTSAEPCPMCFGAIYWARLERVVYANTREEAKAIGFDDSFIYDEIERAGSDSEQNIHFAHMPLEEAQQVFHDWEEKEDKTEY